MGAKTLCGIVAIAVFTTCAVPAESQAQEMKVTLLGTGSPQPVMNRFGPSILVEAGTDKFLFDAGRGALQRLVQIKVKWQDVQGVFLTHLHSDHLVGFPDLWLTGWLVGPGRNIPLKVWGPVGTKRMMALLGEAFEADIHVRPNADHAAPQGVAILTEEISEGVVYEKNGVKITAFVVDHGSIEPAFGYRIDYAGRSTVLSGDTRVSENLIRHAQGVDLLVHEVAAPESMHRAGTAPERIKSILAQHVTPEQAGEVFSRTKPRLAVYSHIIMPTATEQEVIPQTRKTYSGPLELGEDLMVIEVGEKMEVRKPTKSSP